MNHLSNLIVALITQPLTNASKLLKLVNFHLKDRFSAVILNNIVFIHETLQKYKRKFKVFVHSILVKELRVTKSLKVVLAEMI